jgi:hypothetical protein
MSTIIPIPNFEIQDVPTGEELRAMRTALNGSIDTTNDAIEELNSLEHPVRVLAERAEEAEQGAQDAQAATLILKEQTDTALQATEAARDETFDARTEAQEAETGSKAAEQGALQALQETEDARDVTIEARNVTTEARDETVAARTLAQKWAEDPAAPGAPGTKSAKTHAEDAGSEKTKARAWAESDTPPEGIVGAKSAKTHATEAAASAATALTRLNETTTARNETVAARDTTIASAADAATQFGQLLVMTVTGRTSGTPTNGTVTFSTTEDVDVWTTGQAQIVSVTRANDDVFRVHTVVISCPNNASGFLVIKDAYKIRSLGNHRGALDPNVNFYAGTASTIPVVTINFNNFPTLLQKVNQSADPGNSLESTGNQPLPAGVIYFVIRGGSGLTWVYTGGLPGGLLVLSLRGNGIAWAHTGALPEGLRILRLEGNAINWTGTVIGSASAPFANVTEFNLANFRNPNSTVTPTELITLLQGLVNRVGTLPSSPVVTIAEYDLSVPIATIQSATPNIAGTTAEQIRYWIDQVKIKSTNFTLNTTPM